MKVLDYGYIELVDSMGTDMTIAESARISYLGKETRSTSNEELIKLLINSGHTSPLEQVEFRFLVKAPIFVARQWMRHRTWSYSEVSRRYTSKNMEFYIPTFNSEATDWVYKKSIQIAYDSYKDLIELGVKKEIARCVLPVSMYTTFYAKTDLHNLLHFLELRQASDAQYEIREYANAICALIAQVVPITMKIWTEKMKGKNNA